jgi:hypothetical protein
MKNNRSEEAVSKDHFNRRERKVCAKNAKLKYSYSALCADAEALAQALRTLRNPDSYRDLATFAVNGFRLLRHPRFDKRLFAY